MYTGVRKVIHHITHIALLLTSLTTGTWLSCTIGLGAIAFILVEAIPIFNYLIAMIGSFSLAPISMALPGWLWLHDRWDWYKGSAKQQLAFWFHMAFIPLGLFFTVAGTYGVVKMIIDAYASGLIGEFEKELVMGR